MNSEPKFPRESRLLAFRGSGLIRALLLLWLNSFCFTAHAHLGNPNVYFEGEAGPYQARVIIRPPAVVPGLAQIHVRLLKGHPERVTVLPARWDTGRKGAPPPDEAKLAPGETNLYTASLWLMKSGAFSVFVNLEGGAKTETLVVPLNSFALKRLEMSRPMGWAFAIFGTVLFLALINLIGTAVRESVVPPGEIPPPRRRLLGRVAMVVAFVVFSSVLAKGRLWWSQVDQDFSRNRLFTPTPAEAAVRPGENGPVLVLQVDEKEARRRDGTPFIPDHGKMMHLFLVSDPRLDVFAHLHPKAANSGEFESPLPPLPGGKYRIYADVTRESGFAETLTASFELRDGKTAANGTPPPGMDPDDSWIIQPNAPPLGPLVKSPSLDFPNDSDAVREWPPGSGVPFVLSGGYQVIWEKRHLQAGRETTLHFKVTTRLGAPVLLEPYLEMYGHAALLSEDGKVFTHLHPSGTYSVASQQMFVKREKGLAAPPQGQDVVCGKPDQDLFFPCEFPKPGPYRVWVQVKIGGQILTGAFKMQADDEPVY